MKKPSASQSSTSHWNYSPEVPIAVSPVFSKPLNPTAIFKWFWDSWFLVSERLILVGIALISWFYLQPPLEQSQTFAVDWIAQMWLRNVILMVLVAGGLHLWFYIFKGQGDTLRFDTRDKRPSSRFTFGTQLRDNIFWTLVSGVSVWTAYEALMMWAFANGYLSILSFSDHPIWFIALFFLIPIWESFYFYWIHRALHWRPLYRFAHHVHHRNSNVGPWSGLSMHPIEHVMFLGSVLVHFLIVSHPIHILYHLQYYCLTAATTHSGFEGLFIGGKKRLSLGTFHHQMHHRYFECNYGSLEIPFDKVFKSFHDGTEQSMTQIRERRKQVEE